jgi:aryl-alcohol dehydrogenase-like predicted oxidoreductase
MKANAYARANSKTPFVIYQGPYSTVERDLEREIISMYRPDSRLNALT